MSELLLDQIRRQQQIAFLPWEKKKSAHKQQRKSFLSKILNLSWKNKARQVNEERLNFYKSKGNWNKASIYALKLGIELNPEDFSQ